MGVKALRLRGSGVLAVEGHAGDDQRDTEDLQRRGHPGQEHDPADQDIGCRTRFIPDIDYVSP
jgi:hypothetical protein